MIVERMLPAGHISGQDRWVRAEVAADHPGRRYQWSDLHFLHDATELERAGWIRDGQDYVRRWP